MEPILLIVRVALGGSLFLGALYVLYHFAFKGEVHPDDLAKPLYKQRIKMGGGFKPHSYQQRWGGWIVLSIQFGIPLAFTTYLGLSSMWQSLH